MNFINSMIMISLMSSCWWRKSIILMLLSLEMLLISIFMALSSSMSNPSIMLLLMLTIMASGSSIGLSTLVAMSRSHYSSSSLPIWKLTFDKINNSTNNINMSNNSTFTNPYSMSNHNTYNYNY